MSDGDERSEQGVESEEDEEGGTQEVRCVKIGKYIGKTKRVRDANALARGSTPKGSSWLRGIQGSAKGAEKVLGEHEYKQIKEQYEAAGEKKRTQEQDGLIELVLRKGELTDGQVRAMFVIGKQRLDRIRSAGKDKPLPRVACNGG